MKVVTLHGLATWAVLLAACGAESRQPAAVPPPSPVRSSVRFISGRGQTDTIGAAFKTAVVVRAIDTTGAPRVRVPVSFEILPSGDPRIPPQRRADGLKATLLLTDTEGKAVVPIEFGCVAGTWILRARDPATADTDTLTFVVNPGKPVSIAASPRDTALSLGATAVLGISMVDRCGNDASGGVTFAVDSGSSVIAVASDGRLTGVSVGRARVRVQLAPGSRGDTTRISVVPNGVLGVAVGGYALDVGIGIVNLDGSGFRLLTPEPNQYPFPSWNPDGTAIAYNAGPIPVGILYRVDMNGVRTKLSTLGAMQSETWPRYSPDGQYIYFTGGYYPDSLDTYRMAADGSGPRVRVTPRRPWSTRYWKASPSRDGTLLAYSEAGSFLHVMNLATGADRVLQTNSGAESPRFSPDGAWIAFADEYDNALKLIRPDGTGLRTLVTTSFLDRWGHDWSPDGAWIVYRRLDALWLVRAADGLTFPLPYSRDFFFPTWRPR